MSQSALPRSTTPGIGQAFEDLIGLATCGGDTDAIATEVSVPLPAASTGNVGL